jgi:cytochrome c oxidase subunit 4
MSSHETHAHAAHHDDHDKNAVKIYAGVLFALLILTAITVFASTVNFGSGMINVVVALGIATVKASLVGLFFMHLIHDRPMNSIIMVGSFVFLGIFLISCYTDFVTRDPLLPTNIKVEATPGPGAGTPVPNPAAPGAAPGSGPVANPGANPGVEPAKPAAAPAPQH